MEWDEEWGVLGGVFGRCVSVKNNMEIVAHVLSKLETARTIEKVPSNVNVVEMALETFHFVQGLSRTPLLFIPRYPTNIFKNKCFQKENIDNQTSENLECLKMF